MNRMIIAVAIKRFVFRCLCGHILIISFLLTKSVVKRSIKRRKRGAAKFFSHGLKLRAFNEPFQGVEATVKTFVNLLPKHRQPTEIF